MSAPVPIGGDWLEMTDPNTGKKYYANKATSKTQWTYPEELNKSEVTETTTTTTTTTTKAAAATTTTKAAAATTKTTTDSTDDAWLEKVDPNSGKTYYYNKKTNETSWVKPGTGNEWIESTDPNTGKTCYINMLTRKTQWTKPEGFKGKNEGEAKPVAKAETTTTTTVKTTVTTEEVKPNKTEDAPKAPESSANDRFAKIRQIRNKKEGAGDDTNSGDKTTGGVKPKATDDAKAKSSEDGKKTQGDMNKGETLVRKNLLQKYNEMNKDIDF